MHQYDRKKSILTEEDYLAVPSLAGPQQVSPGHRPLLKQVREIIVEAGPLTWLRTMSTDPAGGYYASLLPNHSPPLGGFRPLPWRSSAFFATDGRDDG